MDREIKFRAWFDKDSKDHPRILKYSYLEYNVEIDEKGNVLDIEGGWDIQARFNIPLMQYVGLEDKNGKEIYEGDIVTSSDYINGKVIFGDNYSAYPGSFIVDTKNNQVLFSDYFMDGYDIEVIGNIYENIELLSNSTEEN